MINVRLELHESFLKRDDFITVSGGFADSVCDGEGTTSSTRSMHTIYTTESIPTSECTMGQVEPYQHYIASATYAYSMHTVCIRMHNSTLEYCWYSLVLLCIASMHT